MVDEPSCWDSVFSYSTCCPSTDFPTVLSIENSVRWQDYMREAQQALIKLERKGPGGVGVYRGLWSVVQSALAAVDLARATLLDQIQFASAAAVDVFNRVAKVTKTKKLPLIVNDEMLAPEQLVDGLSGIPAILIKSSNESRSSVFHVVNIFPTEIVTGRVGLSRTIRETIVSLALDDFNSLKQRFPRFSGSELNNLFFAFQMENASDLVSLNSEISQHMRTEVLKVGKQILNKEDVDITMWATITENERMPFHDHPLAILSGCYYPIESSIPLSFQDPRGGEDSSAPFHRYAYFLPKDDEFVIFPPWLKHQVVKNFESKPRVAFAFNFFEKQGLYGWHRSVHEDIHKGGAKRGP